MSETRKSFKDRAKERLTSSFKLKKSDESHSSREDLEILEGEVHGRENPLAWENLPSQIRDRLDPFTLSSMQGDMLNTSGTRVVTANTVEFSGPMGPITTSKTENKKRTRHITQPKGTLRHNVKTTDTLNRIAAMYDTTPSELKKLNKLMTATIFPDQVIYVPDKDYFPSEPSSPVQQSPTDKEPPKSHSAPETPRDKRFAPVEVPIIRQGERPRTKSESGSNRSAPGAAKRVLPRPLSEAEAERLDQECLARFIKVNVKHITDGQGVVSGVLLVTPNAIMFDPNVSDPLVKELGADQYGVIAPMETVISAAMYHDIAAMKLKGVPKDESGVKPLLYHAPTCPMYEEISELPLEEEKTENGEEEKSAEETREKDTSEPAGADKESLLHRKESARKRRKEEMTRTCSCGALSVEEGDSFEVPSPCGGSVPEEVVEGNLNAESGIFEIGDGSGEVSAGQGVQSDTERGVKEAKMDDGINTPEGVAAEGTQDGQTDETEASPGLLSRTLGSISSFGSTISTSNFTNLVDFSSGLFTRNQDERGKVKDVHDGESAPSAGGETPASPHPPSEFATPSSSAPPDVIPSPRLSSPSSPPIVENVVKLDDRPDLFRSLNELIPKPAQHFEDPPLYLCLKIGKPLNKKVPQHGPIESYMKNRPKSEYWFSIPRDKVDALYAFFVQWSPNIYGGDDIDPLSRGFIMVDEEEGEEQPKKTMDIIDDYYKPEMKRLTRQMTKDWEIVNVEEMKRRHLIYDEDKLPLPELSHPSTIMKEEHIRTLSKNLPPRSEGYPWTLAYSSDLHGFSLKTLYRSMQSIDSQILLILRDTHDAVFGALLSNAVKQKDHFYGTGECYLFTFLPEFRRFNWTGANNFFIRGDTDNLEIGAGDGSFGLWLDSDLYHGRTQKCDTFNNDILSETEDFVLKAIEAWAFV